MSIGRRYSYAAAALALITSAGGCSFASDEPSANEEAVETQRSDFAGPRRPAPRPDPDSPEAAEYEVRLRNEGLAFREALHGFEGTNPEHQLQGNFGESGAALHPARTRSGEPSQATIRLRARALSRAGQLVSFGHPDVVKGECADEDVVDTHGECVQRLEMHHEGVVEWWVNTNAGLEHGFTIQERLGDGGPLRVELEVEGAEVEIEEHGRSAELVSGDSAIRYAGLFAIDADGQELPVWMDATTDGLALVVDDATARYPVVIDPVASSAAWSIEINVAGAEFGSSVAVAGDVNGDGLSDVVIGAAGFDNGGSTDVGRAYLVYGDSDMTSPDVTFEPPANQANARFGDHVLSVGDVNGDDLADVAVAVPDWDGSAGADSGAVFIWYGGNTAPAAPSLTLEGAQAGQRFGASVAFGDVQRDGYSDVVIGSPEYDGSAGADSGRAQVFFGGAAGLSTSAAWSTEGPSAGAQHGHAVAIANALVGAAQGSAVWVGGPYADCNDLAGADCSMVGSNENGYVVMYRSTSAGVISTTHDGYSVGWDLEHRGLDMKTIGVIGDSVPENSVQTSWVLVHHGAWRNNIGSRYPGIEAFGSDYTTRNDPTDYGAASGGPLFYYSTDLSEEFGASFGTGGDVDGNGTNDVVLGAPAFDAAAAVDAGRIVLARTFRAELSTVELGWDTFLEGDQAGARLGHSISSAGDVNGDGFSDIIYGAPGYDNGQVDEGRVWIHLGFNKTLPDFTGTRNDAVFRDAGSGFGLALDNAGDVNGDGFDDHIVGSPDVGSGEAQVWYGRDVHLGFATAANWTATGNGSSTNARFGAAVAGIGDVNGDGYDDVAVGAPDHSQGSASEGAFYVFHGSAAGLSTTPAVKIEGSFIGRRLGESVARAGDVNGDGYADVIVGEPSLGSGGTASVYLGSSTGLSTSSPAAFTFTGPQGGANCGAAVASAGDRNGDGFGDIAIGCPNHDGGGAVDSGIVYVVFGGASALGSSASYEGTMSCATRNNLFFGRSVAAGNINADGLPDLLVGAPGTSCGNTNEGGALAIPTVAGGGFGTALAPIEGGRDNGEIGDRVALIDLDGDGQSAYALGGKGRNHVFQETKSTGDVPRFFPCASSDSGTSGESYPLASAGDFNGDGFEDVVVRVATNFRDEVKVCLGGERADARENYQALHGGSYLTEPGSSTPLAVGGRLNSAGGFGVRWNDPPTPYVHDRLRIQANAVPISSSAWFSGTAAEMNSGFVPYPSGALSSEASLLGITGPAEDAAYRVRVRLAYGQSTQVTTPYSAWRYFRAGVTPTLRTGSCPGNFRNSGSGVCDACDADWFGAGCDVQCRPAVECNSLGTCDSAGACVCNAGFAGASCQYSDAATCNGNGTVDNAGACTCDAGWLGSACQYSDATTCNGNGSVDNAGSCTCNSGWDSASNCSSCASGFFGPTCSCTNAGTCNGNGICNSAGACVCQTGFGGAGCDSCDTNYFAYPTCRFCEAGASCGGNGTCDVAGDCSCTSPWVGDMCQYSDATTCNGNGTVDSAGNCTCNMFFTGASCNACVPGRVGPNCEYSDATTCNGNGTAQFDGSCVCNSGFAGAACDLNSSSQCNDNGVIQPDASCLCNGGFAGASCDQCDTNYFDYDTCRFCEASTTCNGQGVCSATGFCACDAGSAGDRCQYSDATTCNGNGTAQNDGSCTCDAGFAGAQCDSCASGFFGPTCSCTNAGTCTGNGTCNAAGACDCSSGFGGAACDQCATGFSGYPSCVPCDAATDCRGVGTCNASGGCDCPAGYAGSQCQFSRALTCSDHGEPNDLGGCTCDAGFAGTACNACDGGFGYPNCRSCDDATTCNSNGTCDGLGQCVCNATAAGANCEFTRSGTCSGNGAPSDAGGCTCDAGFGGPTCGLDRADCSGRGVPQASGDCLCDAGFGGETCGQSSADACNGAGALLSDGTCECAVGIAGDACDTCATDRYDYPTCRVCLASQCLGHGTCDSTGSCACDAGFAGEFCQHSDGANCNDQGAVQSDGSCVCNSGWAGASCQYSDAELCRGLGEARDDGQCDCEPEYAGNRCQWTVADICFGPGRVTGPDRCSCNTGFSGERCDQCDDYYSGYPDCVRCDEETDCSGNGSCQTDATCDCDDGWIGTSCQFRAGGQDCNYGGEMQPDGTCECFDRYAGDRCQYNRWNTCSGGGDPNDDGSCTCSDDYTDERGQLWQYNGPECQHTRRFTCRGLGSPNMDGTCRCDFPQLLAPNCADPVCTGENQYGHDCGECIAEEYCNGTEGREAERVVGSGYCVGTQDTSLSYDGAACMCPPGSYGPNCVQCPAGMECAGGFQAFGNWDPPVVCEPGEAAPVGSGSCTVCPDGTWSAGGRGAATCNQCNCNDYNPCTVDTCDSVTGECTFTMTEGCMLCGNGTCDLQVREQYIDSSGNVAWRESGSAEDCNSCAVDCGICPVCGDDICSDEGAFDRESRREVPPETCWNCPLDCQTCVYPEANLPGFVPPTPPAPGMRPEPSATRMCGGTPQLSGTLPISIDLEDMQFSSPGVGGRGLDIRAYGGVEYSHSWNASENTCQWDAEGGLGLNACIGGQCTALDITSVASCQREPVCSDAGYTCELGDPASASCRVAIDVGLQRAWRYGIGADFGPFYAELQAELAARLSVRGSAYWGEASMCNGTQYEGALVGTGTVSGSASAGVRIGGVSAGISISASGCIGVGFAGLGGCNIGGRLLTGAEATITVPAVDIRAIRMGPWTYEWQQGGDVCL